MFLKRQHLHFTGIGGIGMSGIAEVLLRMGFSVSGSDLSLTPVTERLRELGAMIHAGHEARHVAGAGALVVTSAVAPANPELLEAKRLGIPVVRRGELLAELMRTRYGIAVGGSHGKTSTTTMAATILVEAQRDPTVIVGGRVSAFGGATARMGSGELLVVESDESDGSFLKLNPIVSVITNIDREHLDHYATLEQILDAFTEFANKVPFYGCVVACADDENVGRILPRITRRTITYGRSGAADIVITNIERGPFASRFQLRAGAEELGWFTVQAPGMHNVLNATAAVAVARELEISPEVIAAGLAEYRGVDRRFQKIGEAAGVTVIDDYGHHPTEIRATLSAARQCGFAGVHVIFQPHRYTRTQHLMEEFAQSFGDADTVQVLDIYAASEAPVAGVTSEELAARMRASGHEGARYAGSAENALREVAARAGRGDAVVTLGAGNVWQCAGKLLGMLRDKE